MNEELWKIANDLRGAMDSLEFRNYITGILFYKYLTEKMQNNLDSILKIEKISYNELVTDEKLLKKVKENVIKEAAIFIDPKYNFSSLYQAAKNNDENIITLLNDAFEAIENSTIGFMSEESIKGIFSDLDLNNNRLGATKTEKKEKIIQLITKINDIHFDNVNENIGDAFDNLLKISARDAGRMGTEIYTPTTVTNLVAKLVMSNGDKIKSIYDPVCGSGSLLIKAWQDNKDDMLKIYGQELNVNTYNLIRMNMFMHNINNNFTIYQGDSLENDKVKGIKFDRVVGTPTFGANWSASEEFLKNDERFNKYPKLAPKSKSEYAFIQHMLYHLEDEGVMVTVMPHGVLFRGAAEGVIRQQMIEKENVLDAVIGLPSNLFLGTSIPVVILVFKKNRTSKDILFIDASGEFEKVKMQNILTNANIEKIYNTYVKREEIEKYSRNVSIEEIQKNEYNLNIPRYIDTFEEEKEIDIMQVMKDLAECRSKQAQLIEEINKEFDEIICNDKESPEYGKSLLEMGINL